MFWNPFRFCGSARCSGIHLNYGSASCSGIHLDFVVVPAVLESIKISMVVPDVLESI